MEESLTRRLIRYTIVVAIVVVLGGMYVQREILTDDEVMVAVPAPVATATPEAASDDATTDDGAEDAADDASEDSADGAGGEMMVSVGLLDDRSVELDELAPDFRLTDLDGNVVLLSDFRGKTVVLNFWASWCPPCREEMPEFQALWDERGSGGSDDLVVLAVNFLRDDSVGAATNFIEANEFTFPVLFDTTRGDVATRYGVRGLPATFFIDRNGVVRTTALGPVFGNLLETGVADADTEGGTVQ
jgi:cytochrome c-type biogenesis protein